MNKFLEEIELTVSKYLAEAGLDYAHNKVGETKFTKTDGSEFHIQKIIEDFASANNMSKEDAQKVFDDKMAKSLENMKQSTKLNGTMMNNIAESTAFEMLEGMPSDDVKFSKRIFQELFQEIKSEVPEFYPLSNVFEPKRIEPTLWYSPDKLTPEYNGVGTAACTPDAKLIFNVSFMEKLMKFASVKGIKADPKKLHGKKYESQGGKIPDAYLYAEFVLLHEIMHYGNGDFYFEKAYNLNGNLVNYVGDFVTNYNLVKSGYAQLPMGLFNDEINYDRFNSYQEMYDTIEEELNKLRPKDQENMMDQMDKMGDEMPKNGEGQDPNQSQEEQKQQQQGQQGGGQPDQNGQQQDGQDGQQGDQQQGQQGQDGQQGDQQQGQQGQDGQQGDQQGDGQQQDGQQGQGQGQGQQGDQEGDPQQGQGQGGGDGEQSDQQGDQEGEGGSGSGDGEDSDKKDGKGSGGDFGKETAEEKSANKAREAAAKADMDAQEQRAEQQKEGEGKGASSGTNPMDGKKKGQVPKSIDDAMKGNAETLDKAQKDSSRETKTGMNKDAMTPGAIADMMSGGNNGSGQNSADGNPYEIAERVYKPKLNWKNMLKKMVPSGTTQSETYSKPSRRTTSTMVTVAQTGAGAVKPGTKEEDSDKRGLCFVLDNSGSTMGAIGAMQNDIMNLMNKQAKKLNGEMYVIKFSNDVHYFKVDVKKKKYGRITDIQDFINTGKSNVKCTKAVNQLFKSTYGGGTELTSKVSLAIKGLLKAKFNTILFSDTDIVWGENAATLKQIYNMGKKSFALIGCDKNDYKAFVDLLGSKGNITHL